MPHDLTLFDFRLPEIDDWISGDDRVLAFSVVDANGDPVDISNADVSWYLTEQPYHDDPADAVLSGDDSGVELVTDSRVDTSAGEWEVRVDGDATAELWGSYTHRPVVEQSDGTSASWIGTAVITA